MNELTSFIDEVAAESHLRVEADLGDGFVRLRSDEAERRQAAHDIRTNEDLIIELLRNSRDAHARNIFLAFGKTGEERVMVVIDDGDGVPKHLQERIFEPRVTSKLDTMHIDKWGVHGRGMALYSIKVNSEQAHIAQSAPGKGCAIYAKTHPDRVSEKRDQSTFPQFILNDGGKVTIRGPKNILRTTCEFALEHKGTLNVYLGTITQIAATLHFLSSGSVSAIERAFANGLDEAPVTKKLAFARDCQEFSAISQQLGLEMSDRTARRIMEGELQPVPEIKELIELVDQRTSAQSSAPAKRRKQGQVIHFEKNDLTNLKEHVAQGFKPLAQAYYLQEEPDIVVQKRGEALHITIPLFKND